MTLKNLFLAHALLEIIGGVLLILRPELILIGSTPTTELAATGRMYGMAAFTMGSMSFLLYKAFEYKELFRKSALVIMAFHVVVALNMYGLYSKGIVDHAGPFAVHLIFALLFGVLYIREKVNFANELGDS